MPTQRIGARARESVVSGTGYAAARGASRSAAWVGAALALSLAISLPMSLPMSRPAQAQKIESGGCVGGWRSSNCVTLWAPAGDPFARTVPPPANERQLARGRERDRRWMEICRPSIEPDRYGVNRYHYAVPGCAFGQVAY
jgi:hypothetical protein